MSIEKELRQNWDSVVYPEPDVPEPPMLLAAGPADQTVVSDAGAGRGSYAGYNPRAAQLNLEPQARMESYDPTVRQKIADFLQAGFEAFGTPRYQARKNAQTIMGGGSSNLPLNMGIADIIPFLGTGLQTQEAVRTGEEAVQSLQAGEPGKAALQAGAAAVGMIPGAVATVKAAKALKNMPVGLTTKGAKLTPNIEVPVAGDIDKPAFKKWFGESKVTDETGNPEVWYHGTSMNIDEFKPGVADAMYFSKSPEFAGGFTGKGPDQVIEKQASEKGWVGPNIVPVYLKAEKPFDYENADHRKMVIETVLQKHGQKRPDGQIALFENGKPTLYDAGVLDAGLNSDTSNWILIERKEIQDAIKSLGFDSFYVKEENTKNLAVYKPEQIKSVFNKGTWNPNDPRILHGAGVVGVGSGAGTMATSQQEPK
jgi:hypothetical protein